MSIGALSTDAQRRPIAAVVAAVVAVIPRLRHQDSLTFFPSSSTRNMSTARCLKSRVSVPVWSVCCREKEVRFFVLLPFDDGPPLPSRLYHFDLSMRACIRSKEQRAAIAACSRDGPEPQFEKAQDRNSAREGETSERWSRPLPSARRAIGPPPPLPLRSLGEAAFPFASSLSS